MNREKIPIVSLYTKDGFPLCNKAETVLLKRVSCEAQLPIKGVNITSDSEIYEECKEQIPVICSNGGKAFKYHVNI